MFYSWILVYISKIFFITYEICFQGSWDSSSFLMIHPVHQTFIRQMNRINTNAVTLLLRVKHNFSFFLRLICLFCIQCSARLLGIELGNSGRAACALHLWVISLAQSISQKIHLMLVMSIILFLFHRNLVILRIIFSWIWRCLVIWPGSISKSVLSIT